VGYTAGSLLFRQAFKPGFLDPKGLKEFLSEEEASSAPTSTKYINYSQAKLLVLGPVPDAVPPS
jgi:hypothetical protein